MINGDFPLDQKITITFRTDEPARQVVVTILDNSDGVSAEDSTAAYAANQFSLDDILGTLTRNAEITVEENGNVEHYTGATFDDGGVLRDLDGVEPVSVIFADYQPAA
jgi:hypothetical protein